MVLLFSTKKTNQTKGLTMRQSRTACLSIFDLYSQHEFGVHLRKLSDLPDQHPEIIALLERDLIDEDCTL